MNPIIRIRDLRKAFSGRPVLEGVDLDVPEGAICAVVGQSGTGKSVLFKCIMGIMKPDAGRVWYREYELTAMEHDALIDLRKHFGYSFQNAALFDSMTVEENIAFPLREALGLKNRKQIKKQVDEMLEWIGLPEIGRYTVDELSGGMRKRVGVARSLVMKPDVLFFDEPTTGLDPVLSETIDNLVVRVNGELGVSCILITHDIPAAFRIADKIAFLDGGRIVAEGSAKEVAASDNELVRNFLRISFSELPV
ncbi:MAG: ABC transporter ATP-binding protein [Treponema sp. GWB1_62_6]|nr:MAG: ABC transporter ATP-binding protein [Treponema sp. GWB1_62_6]OHE62525.1 MAG: ABC transporter ATP-binding protein [Treponema sp. GWA1_62_8]OHE67949.1 MAG: ABC transporter ATP-binding protein [Treponema sp. RIFOXYC1_FULL_61_9]OHE68548.1 MAG: ABC transporter ATP-binding protein [Treponema sp. GWC1_61_84]HCM27853.1 ABC transporter ATP-binding protein [Treponema sp.]